MSSMVDALQRIAFNGDPLQFMLIATTYQPFISIFHMTDVVQSHPELAAIRESSSSSYAFVAVEHVAICSGLRVCYGD